MSVSFLLSWGPGVFNFVRSFVRSFARSFFRLLVRSLVCSFVRSFVRFCETVASANGTSHLHYLTCFVLFLIYVLHRSPRSLLYFLCFILWFYVALFTGCYLYFDFKERAQMEAIQALQLQTDAKHRRITSQVMNWNKRYENGQIYSNGCFHVRALRNLQFYTEVVGIP